MTLKRFYRYIFPFITTFFISFTVAAAPSADLWKFWSEYESSSEQKVNHEPWDQFLSEYLDASHPSSINLLRYSDVTPTDKSKLESYIRYLEEQPVRSFNRDEQFAYWVNLYNAATVNLILENYPVKSIRDIKLGGLFSGGPWDEKILEVNGTEVSLNDIEHRILRPIWKDERIHYVVNCASMGCPNLQPVAFRPRNLEMLLEKAAKEYINHERGARLEDGRLYLSSIYSWYQEDFGENEKDVIDHLKKHADRDLSQKLQGFSGKIKYEYDWSINEAE